MTRSSQNRLQRKYETSSDDIVSTYLFAIKIAVVVERELRKRKLVVISAKKLIKYFSHYRLIIDYLQKKFDVERDGTWYLVKRLKKRERREHLSLSPSEIDLINKILL